MSSCITLEDGTGLWVSNMGLGGALEHVADALSPTEPLLCRWLRDNARRGGGLMDFDLRGLGAKHREAFWIGMAAAFDRLREWDQATSFSPTVAAVRLIHEKGAGRPDVVNETDVTPVDLGDLWFSE